MGFFTKMKMKRMEKKIEKERKEVSDEITKLEDGIEEIIALIEKDKAIQREKERKEGLDAKISADERALKEQKERESAEKIERIRREIQQAKAERERQ